MKDYREEQKKVIKSNVEKMLKISSRRIVNLQRKYNNNEKL